MRIKTVFLTLAVIGVLLFSSGYLYAQEAEGTTQIIPAGTESDTDGNDDFDISDDELERILSSTETNPHAIVGPLVTTKWAQGFPFNNLFPIVHGHAKTNASGVFLTDCTITATAQIIAYHKHPIRGTGQSTKIMPQGVTVPLVDLSATYYDWGNMLDHYRSNGRNSTEQQRNAVATLMYHVAAARGASDLRMLYSAHFGFDRGIQNHTRNYYTDAEWVDMIRRQLDAGLPVWYYSKREGGGHGFVIDGYDSQGRFHVNWGWRGARDGWYPINGLRPYDGRFYDRNQSMTINIKRDEGNIGSNELGLKNFTVSMNSAAQNELITVNITLRSSGIFPGGQRGVALTDNNGNIVYVIKNENFGSLSISSTRTTTMRCIVPDTVSPGQYQLRIVTRMEGEQEWKLVTASDREAGIPNAIPITITAGVANGGGYGLAFSSFSIDEGRVSASQGDKFNVNYNIRNLGTETFEGSLRAVLMDNAGNEIVIGTRASTSFAAGSGRRSSVSCSVPNTVRPGQYRLRIIVRPAGGEWKIITMSYPNISNSIDFTVR